MFKKIINWFKSILSTPKNKEEYYTIQGTKYPVYASRNGRKYILRIAKSGTTYRMYI